MSGVVSVVIPAHNEAGVLGRTLHALLSGAEPGELDVVVVANACTDGTADVARAFGVRVIDTEVPGKVPALLLGDRSCAGFPRLYLDADVELSAASVRELAGCVDAGALACAPVPEYDLTGASALVTRFHRVLEHLMVARRGLAGTGAYMLAEQGHARIFPMPPVIADDGYVHRSFTAAEAAVAPGARSLVRPPRSAVATIRRRARVRRGNAELDRLGHRATGAPVSLGELSGAVRAGEVGLLDAGCYLAVLVAERVLLTWRRLRGTQASWSADTTSRAAESGR
ncbi:glycosyltransferase [Actinokineospora spheciospongiae]|uniref:glycosyltransferase n=1 Tax=Actinokineospora spheciospongiae TaxID=909613 RepID=UPI000D980540|nr:glycosyltransferase [Actinokineospora spheciospongiae]PWW64099.1 glycosyl transferase family 2 [Actinokineospora spheciospongiae]